MSTRAVIKIVDKQTGEVQYLRHHWDGYPEYVGVNLKNLTDQINNGHRQHVYANEIYTEGNIKKLARDMVADGVYGINGRDDGYEPVIGDYYDNGDWEYAYEIVKDGKKYTILAQHRDWNGNMEPVKIPATKYKGKLFEVRQILTKDEVDKMGELQSKWSPKTDDLRYTQHGYYEDNKGHEYEITRLFNSKPKNSLKAKLLKKV